MEWVRSTDCAHLLSRLLLSFYASHSSPDYFSPLFHSNPSGSLKDRVGAENTFICLLASQFRTVCVPRGALGPVQPRIAIQKTSAA